MRKVYRKLLGSTSYHIDLLIEKKLSTLYRCNLNETEQDVNSHFLELGGEVPVGEA